MWGMQILHGAKYLPLQSSATAPIEAALQQKLLEFQHDWAVL